MSLENLRRLLFRKCPVSIEFKEYATTIVVPNGVFAPLLEFSYATHFLFPEAENSKGLRVLDLGTGPGTLAIIAAKCGAKEVLGTDISHKAIQIAQANAIRNAVNNICSFRVSDLFGRVTGRFDRVFANLPIEENVWEGVDVAGLQKRFLSSLPGRLAENGCAYMTSASFGDVARLEEAITSHKLCFRRTSKEIDETTWHKYELRAVAPSNG